MSKKDRIKKGIPEVGDSFGYGFYKNQRNNWMKNQGKSPARISIGEFIKIKNKDEVWIKFLDDPVIKDKLFKIDVGLKGRLYPNLDKTIKGVDWVNKNYKNIYLLNLKDKSREKSTKSRDKSLSDTYNELHCDKYNEMLQLHNKKSKKYNQHIQKCNIAKIKEGIESDLTLKDLIDKIKHYNKNNVNDFLELFGDPGTKGIKCNKNHVYEALWKLVFYECIDNLYNSKFDRQFYNRLEGGNIIDDREFLNQKINGGSSNGIADIYFEDILKSLQEPEPDILKKELSCMPEIKKKLENNKYLLSVKYYKKEKSVSDYDIQDILVEANEYIKDNKYNIILLINNKNDLEERMTRSKKTLSKKYHSIYDIKDLNEYYTILLRRYISGVPHRTPVIKNNIELRFHQKYFVNYTIKEIDKGFNKFIWGAVPRSGKSYMIGGLISYVKPNNVLLILGAVSETETQFLELFQTIHDFSDYNIIDIRNTSDRLKPLKKKNIIIISQEQIRLFKKDKDKTEKDKTDYVKNEKLIDNIISLKDKIVFFDEVHQGSGHNSMQNEVLDTFVFETDYIAFVMVTATFAKPYLKYMNKGEQTTKLIQWRYEDIQYMKEISKPGIQDKLYEEINDKDKIVILNKLFDEYLLSNYSLKYLEDEYTKYPNLTILTPVIDDELVDRDLKSEDSLFDIYKNLRAEHIFEIEKDKFKRETVVDKLLDYIIKNVYHKLLLTRFNYRFHEEIHTQLWFLPTHVGRRQHKSPEDGHMGIEPLSRNLAISLMKNELFKRRFCILIVHSIDIKTTEVDFIERIDSGGHKPVWKNVRVNSSKKGSCVSTYCGASGHGRKDKNGLKNCIEYEELQAAKKGKSTIILTGKSLRLGVSLPCVDIAIHMDPIQSVDIIYQSMFRVLTERPNKKTGFFIDLLSQRQINFIYEYDNYVSSDKVITDSKVKQGKILEKLALFNFNGIEYAEDTEYKEIYDKLMEAFYLNNDIKFTKMVTLVNNEDIDSVIRNIEPGKLHMIFERIEKLGIKYSELKDKSTKHKILDRAGHMEPELYMKEKNKNEPSIKPKKDKGFDFKKTTKLIINFLREFTSLIILFYDNENEICNEKSIKRNLENIFQNTITSENIDNICDEDKYILECNYRFLLNKPNKELINDLNEYRIIFSDIIEDIFLKNKDNSEYIKFYCNIKNNISLMKKNSKDQLNNPSCGDKFIKNDKVLSTIRKYLTVRIEEKNLYGEVFTPIELICEMMDKLPKNVWSNPELKWLDPANGIGNFPVVVYYKLMEGLEKVISNTNKRSKHIIEKMLYMVELNPVNVRLCRKIFKMIDQGATPNIVKHDFLTFDSKKKFGIEKFDVIMGNPPWNDIKIGKQSGSRAKNSLWDKFIYKSLELLNKNGYLGFINPAQWRGLGPEYHKIWDIFSSKDMLFLHIYSKKKGQLLFNVGSRFDIYILKNNTTNIKTYIIDELDITHNINIKPLIFLPNYAYKEIGNILTTENKGIDVIHDYFYANTSKIISYKSYKDFKNKVVHSITKDGPTYIYTNDIKKGHYGIPKVILSMNEKQYSHPEQNDYEGKYGMSQISFGIPIKSKKEGDLILRAIDTPKFNKIIAATKWGAYQTDWRMFKYFKKDFYKYFLDKSPPPPEVKGAQTKKKKNRHKSVRHKTKRQQHKRHKTKRIKKK